MKSLIKISTLALIMTFGIGITSLAANTGKINTETVRMRTLSSTDGEIVTTLNNGTEVEIITEENGWYKVKYNDEYEGYIRKDLIDISEEETPVEEEKPVEENENLDSGNQEQPQEEIKKKEQFPMEVTAKSTTKIYILPSLTSSVIGEVKENDLVTVNDKTNNWSYVSYNGLIGWSRTNYLENTVEQEITNEQPVENQTSTVIKKGYINNDTGVNLRSEPSTSSSVIIVVNFNEEVDIVEDTGEWYKVNYKDNAGYISKPLVSDAKTSVTSRSLDEQRKKEEINSKTEDKTENQVIEGTSAGEKIVTTAKKYLGYSYVYGGTTPTAGFDCSGFIYYVLNNCGYTISRSCSEQANAGVGVEKSNLQKGDLVFFNNTSSGNIGHVGIYIGNGNFIHAANATRGVVTDTINSGYYNTYYYSARRVF